MVTLNLLMMLKNVYFKKIIQPKNNKIKTFFFFTFISTLIFTSFPLVTQLYIKYLYEERNLGLLLNVTIGIFFIFLIKLIVDILLEKSKLKYFSKVENRIKKRIFYVYINKLGFLVDKKSDLFTRHLSLFLFILKTLYRNIVDVMKIVVIMVIIYFFDRHLFIYSLFASPFFILFYLIVKRIELEPSTQMKEKDNDFGILLKKVSDEKMPLELAKKKVLRHLDIKTHNRTIGGLKFVPINLTMDSFIGFFRLVYLAYFGYFIITAYVNISGLIVGLLYITILIRPCISLLKSVPFYTKCSRSFFKICALYKDETETQN